MSAAVEPAIEVSGRRGDLPRFVSVKERLQLHEDAARRRIAYVVVAGYLAVLFFNIAPLATYLLTQDLQPQDVKDLATTMAVVISGVTGVVGFVLGYYFKSGEPTATYAASTRSEG